MAKHVLELERRTLQGHFSRDLPPVLTIDPGDSLVFQTLDAGWHVDPPVEGEFGRKFEPLDAEADAGHALCGPVAIRGAEPGMTLEVGIVEVRPGSWGWSGGGGGDSEINRRLGVAGGEGFGTFWTLDTDRMVGRDRRGRELRLRPFLGVLGMPPDVPGRQSTAPPRPCGGNVDCKELVAGTKLYLPIPVKGALFSAGDGHALQGDGEVSGVAIECPVERVELRLDLRSDMAIAAPRAWTPKAWITFGFDEDLDQAMLMALDGMIQLMTELEGCDRREALALASLVVDLRITQVVNGVRGVHAVLPHDRLDGR